MSAITPNLRDLGGLSGLDGRVIAHHRVLRSAAPMARDVAPAGITWPPSLVIDLRSSGETEPVHPLAQVGSRIVNLPLLSSLRPGAPADSLHALYRTLLVDGSMFLVELVREVGLAQGPTLIHCAAGKDRTGVSIALLLRLAGVARDAVVADYMLTREAEREIAQRLRKSSGHRLRANLPAAFFDVSPEAIHAVLDVWDEHPRGAEGWFLDVGGTPGHVEQLRRTLLA